MHKMTNSDDKNIAQVRAFIKHNILRNEDFFGHQSECQQVLDLLQRTIEHGESNSALLIGPRGSGKTTLINSVLRQLESYFSSDALLVKLHGLVHTDDRLALIAITSQMNLDNAADGKVFGSFAENLAFLLACLKSGYKDTTKSVIFILEEFDLFSTHHNQTLLYNLFDISQSAQTPICVLGITCRLDVMELLEKRVKSRFSHRQFFLFLGKDNNDHSDLEYRLQRLEYILVVPHNADIRLPTSYKKEWNSHVRALIQDKNFKKAMQKLIDIDLGERSLKNILVMIVSQLNAHNPFLTTEAFEEQIELFEKDAIVELLQDLSVLELCLIIAMKHHNEIYDDQPMNFEMVLTRYMKFAKANSSMQVVPRPVIMKAFEHIENLELISMLSSRTGGIQKEYQLFKLLVFPEQIIKAVKKWPGLPTEVAQWANSLPI